MTYIGIKSKKKKEVELKKRSGSLTIISFFLLFLMDFQARESKNAS